MISLAPPNTYRLSVAIQLIDFRLSVPVPTMVDPSAEMASGVIKVTVLGMFAPKVSNAVFSGSRPVGSVQMKPS
jgi:hypothetical protein